MSLPEKWEFYRKRAERALDASLQSCRGPRSLLEAMRYSVMAGGKRLRPALVMATYELFSKDIEKVESLACALEFIHTYSLIHDDLPAMDNDDFRRGKPTNHKVFGEPLAILAGDALLSEAFRLAAMETSTGIESDLGAKLVVEISRAVGSAGLVGGQVLDIDAESRIDDRELLEETHRMKTGALIRCCVRTGAIAAGASTDELERLSVFAEKIGLAFQVTDDMLDVTSSLEDLGKSIGKDEQQHKTTYISLMGLEGAREYAAGLIDEAIEALLLWQEEAEALREIARFILERKH